MVAGAGQSSFGGVASGMLLHPHAPWGSTNWIQWIIFLRDIDVVRGVCVEGPGRELEAGVGE